VPFEVKHYIFAHIPIINWVNHPAHNVAASHKLQQLTKAHELGLRIPDTLVTQDAAELHQFFDLHKGKLITKPMARGYIERVGSNDTVMYTSRLTPAHLADLDDLAACPTLFQELVDKACDVRVTYVDGTFHAVALSARDLDGCQRCDIRRHNMEDVHYLVITLPSNVQTRLRLMMDHYHLRFAAIDMAVSNDGHWYFFEINPNGQWAWLDLGGITNIAQSFVQLFGKV
jgi:glutathione synthase/RimK-type ligase-like ATP-grasp enzyme